MLTTRSEGRTIVLLALLLTEGAVLGWSSSSGAASSNPVPAQICSNYPANPVLNDSGAYYTASSFMYNNTYFERSVLKVGGVYYMWFSGFQNREFGLYRATSPNGVDWTVGPSAVLPPGLNGKWDSSGPFAPSVVWNGTLYLMYFYGDSGSVQTRSIGVATSKDLIHWAEYAGNPILKPGPAFYDGGYIRNPSVVFHDGSYMMWYKGRSTFGNGSLVVGIDVATSSDGLHWTKYSGNPVLGYTNSSSFSKDLIFEDPSVVWVNGGYILAADDGVRLGYATSADGLHWTLGDGWLVQPSNDTSWSGSYIGYPSLLVNGSTLMLWYFGSSPQNNPTSAYKSGIGLAFCGLIISPSSVTSTQTITRVSTSSVAMTSMLTVTTTAAVTNTVEIPPSASNTFIASVASALAGFGFGVSAVLLARRVPKK